jgi:hypothetical protein
MSWTNIYSSLPVMLSKEMRIKEHCFGYIMASATQQNKQFSSMKAHLIEEHQSVERLGHCLGNVQFGNVFLFVEEGKWFAILCHFLISVAGTHYCQLCQLTALSGQR